MSVAPSWEGLLRTPHPCDHLVQLYTDDAFLTRAVAVFVGLGTATPTAVCCTRFRAADPRSLRTLIAARASAPTVMPPAQAALLALGSLSPRIADAVLERARYYYGGV